MGNARVSARLRPARRLLPRAALPALLAAGLGGLAGCKERARDQPAKAAGEAPAARAAAGDAGAAAAATPAGPVSIPWVSDDWSGALARARAEKKPVFVDLWAPWCHTCLAMKQGVLLDPSLAPFRDRFVWLEIDTDRPQNAPVLEALPLTVWPTFYVLSAPADGAGSPAVQARHLGAASVAQLRALLEEGEAGHLDAMASEGTLAADSPLGLVRAGDRAAAAGDLAAAARAYGEALAAAPADWPRTPAVLVKQISALAHSGDLAGCADVAMREADRTTAGLTASATDFAALASQCAGALDDPRARLLRGRLADAVLKVLEAPDSALSVDDRSDALRVLRELAVEFGDEETARGYATRQRELLDRAVAEAKTPRERMTYNYPRLEVHEYLGASAELVADLERSVAELPEEYDPAYRLASLYLTLGRLDDALKAAERARELIYGPRTARVLILIAEIHEARGDRAAERAARKAVVEHYEARPPGQRSEEGLAAAREALARVGKKPAKK